jgi:hypothetical protein
MNIVDLLLDNNNKKYIMENAISSCFAVSICICKWSNSNTDMHTYVHRTFLFRLLATTWQNKTFY